MSLFVCPVCRGALNEEGGSLRCAAGHCFDRAASGYVNLLTASHMHSKNPGDDRAMAAARRRFLDGGYYAPLRERLAQLCGRYAPPAPTVLDSGCGEGYYTAALPERLPGARVAGIDISKFCLRLAAKRVKGAEFAVASAYSLPLADSSVDLLVNCFSPLAIEEFRRVLKPGGAFLYVVPGAEHLWELKQVLYEKPYKNEEKLTPYEGFQYMEVSRVRCGAELKSGESIRDLFGMTPYAWKTPRAGVERMETLTRLDVTVAFDLHVFRRD